MTLGEEEEEEARKKVLYGAKNERGPVIEKGKVLMVPACVCVYVCVCVRAKIKLSPKKKEGKLSLSR